MGAYYPGTNSVVYYDSGNLHFWSRASGTLVQTIPVTGTSLVNVNVFSVIYTGQVGYEIGLLDWSAKRVLLFNRSTGAFTGMSQLPASAITHNQFRFCYTNNRVWLFNSTLRKWNAYCIWNGLGCPSLLLPVELLDMKATCANGVATVKWSTGSELNSSHFKVERSADGQDWKDAGQVSAAGNSQQLVQYAWTDTEPVNAPVVYYRLRQVDLDGEEEVFQMVPVMWCGGRSTALIAYPNPTEGMLHVVVNADGAMPEGRLELRDATGRVVLIRYLSLEVGQSSIQLDLEGLAAGPYVLGLSDLQGTLREQLRLVKR